MDATCQRGSQTKSLITEANSHLSRDIAVKDRMGGRKNSTVPVLRNCEKELVVVDDVGLV